MPDDNRELTDSAERLQRLLSARPPRLHAGLWRESVVSAARSLADVTRPLLRPSEGGEARTATARAAFEALAVLVELRDPTASEELAELCHRLRYHSDPDIAAEVRLWELVQAADERLDSRAAAHICGELLELLGRTPPEWRHLFAARRAARRLGDAAGADRVHLEFARVFLHSPHAAIAEHSNRFEGKARWLNLTGHIPQVRGPLVGGESFSVESLVGQAVFVEFWATWCGPCCRELPKLKSAYERYRPQGFEIVGISLDDDCDALLTFLDTHSIRWPVLFDDAPGTSGWENPLAIYYGIDGVPTGLLIGRDGRVAATGVRATELAARLPCLLDTA